MGAHYDSPHAHLARKADHRGPLAVLRTEQTGTPLRTERDATPFEPVRDEEERPPESTIVQSTIYDDGYTLAEPASIRETFEHLRKPDRRGNPVAWIGMTHPTARQVQTVAEIFDLHPLAVENAIVAHQRPKAERYGGALFVVLRPATYDDTSETVKFGEVHAFIGPDFVITVRHTAQPELGAVRQRFEKNRHLLAAGPQAILYGLLDFVVDGYAPVLSGLENDIDEIETQVFESDPNVSRRIYELSQEVMELQRAVKPLHRVLAGLERGAEQYGTDPEIIALMRDVHDHVTSVIERSDGFRQSLSEILQLNAILVAQVQNDDMKRLAEVANTQADEVKKASSWARHPLRTDDRGGHLRHELRHDARAPLVLRLPVRAAAHGDRLDRHVAHVQAQGLAVTPASPRLTWRQE